MEGILGWAFQNHQEGLIDVVVEIGKRRGIMDNDEGKSAPSIDVTLEDDAPHLRDIHDVRRQIADGKKKTVKER